MQLVVFKGFLG